MRNVLKFNLLRNKLELDTSPNNGSTMPLEYAMIQEEIREFYEATTLAERIDAMIDVRYVYEGSQLKYNYNMKPMDENLNKIVGQFHRLSSTIVAQELGDDSQYLDKIMDKAWVIVCDINNLKVAELDANGKVIKQEGLPNATVAIAELLKSMLTTEDTDAQ